MRVHGDYHLGQVLWAEGDFYIIDFEGEPARPLDERRRKESPLKDVAGMLRSFSYAAVRAALRAQLDAAGARSRELEPWARALAAVGRRGVPARLPGNRRARRADLRADRVQRDALLELFMLDKALYELNYELNNRPDWVRIPLTGLSELL